MRSQAPRGRAVDELQTLKIPNEVALSSVYVNSHGLANCGDRFPDGVFAVKSMMTTPSTLRILRAKSINRSWDLKASLLQRRHPNFTFPMIGKEIDRAVIVRQAWLTEVVARHG